MGVLLITKCALQPRGENTSFNIPLVATQHYCELLAAGRLGNRRRPQRPTASPPLEMLRRILELCLLLLLRLLELRPLLSHECAELMQS